MARHIIYIPGLGDQKVTGQRLAIQSWWLWGVHPHLFQMNWGDAEPFEPKFDRLLALVDELSKKGSVALVAASAGATAGINTFAARKEVISGLVCIAGKINNPQAIHSSTAIRNPSFAESAHMTNQSLSRLDSNDRGRILSIRGARDSWVPARDSILDGAHNQTAKTSLHFVTIGSQLTLGAPHLLSFLKATM